MKIPPKLVFFNSARALLFHCEASEVVGDAKPEAHYSGPRLIPTTRRLTPGITGQPAHILHASDKDNWRYMDSA